MPAFLRALVRTGVVRLAAADAGIDHSTAYGRRRAHAEFAERWREALAAHAAAKALAEQEEIAALRSGRLVPAPPSIGAGPTSSAHGDEYVLSGGKLRRVHAHRWTAAAERRFFASLASYPSVTLAAQAAGFSTTAIYERRLRHEVFREKWAAAVETSKERVRLRMIELADQAIKDALAGLSGEAPKISIGEALQILKLGPEPHVPTHADGRRRLNAGAEANLRAATSAEIADALRKRLIAFGKRMDEEKRAGKGGAPK